MNTFVYYLPFFLLGFLVGCLGVALFPAIGLWSILVGFAILVPGHILLWEFING